MKDNLKTIICLLICFFLSLLNKFGKVFPGLFFMLACACSPNKGSTDKKSESLQKRDVAWEQERENNLRVRLQEAEGGVVNKPFQSKGHDLIFETDNEVCFDFQKLPSDWYVQDLTRQGRYTPSKDVFGLAVPSTVLGVNYYEVRLHDKVSYEFVSPGQEYVNVFVEGKSKQLLALEYEKKYQNSLRVMGEDFFEPSSLKLSKVDGWNFQAYRLFLCRECPDSKPGGRLFVTDADHNAYFEVFLSDQEILKPKWVETRSPTLFESGFGPPTAKGVYLHSSGGFSVSFVTSAHATPQVPNLFDEIDKVITSLIVECERD